MENYPKPISKLCTNKIYDQMNNSFYKIDNIFGFFTQIKYKKSYIPVLISNPSILEQIDHNILKISINNVIQSIEIGNIRYVDEINNIAIIQIKKDFTEKIQFLEIDENCYNNKELEIYYEKESIYIIQCDANKDISVSYGVINYVNKNEIRYSGNINLKSVCSPIFNLNNKIIGMHINKTKYYNKGIFINFITKKFIIEGKYNLNNYNNEISILLNIDEKEINKKIYFLDNLEYTDDKKIKHFHDNLKELNELNTELYIDNNKEMYKKFFIPKTIGEHNIKLKFNYNLTDCSYMFAGCKNIVKIDFKSFMTQNIINMKYMFYGCKFKNINLFCFDTKNIKYMNYMFGDCVNINNLDIISFDNINKVINMSELCQYK